MEGKSKVKDFFDGLLDFCCNVIAGVLFFGGLMCILTGLIGIIDCFTGGTSMTYGGSGICLAIGAVLIAILGFLPEGFHDRLGV